MNTRQHVNFRLGMLGVLKLDEIARELGTDRSTVVRVALRIMLSSRVEELKKAIRLELAAAKERL